VAKRVGAKGFALAVSGLVAGKEVARRELVEAEGKVLSEAFSADGYTWTVEVEWFTPETIARRSQRK
jgi:hypothetical protein